MLPPFADRRDEALELVPAPQAMAAGQVELRRLQRDPVHGRDPLRAALVVLDVGVEGLLVLHGARLFTVADLAGVRAKLRRADEHRLAYDELFESYLETHPYSILFEFDPETGWHVFRWVVVNEPPLEELSLVFCDILGNLRSALDYLVWQLVLKGGRKPGRQTGFPIVKRERDWAVQGASALKGVGEEWAELIEAMQPFQRFDRPELHPLAILEHVNNLTKHRFLPAAVLSVENFGYLINIADVP